MDMFTVGEILGFGESNTSFVPIELPWVDHRPIFVLFQYLQYKVMEEDIHLTCLDVTMQFYFDVHNYSSDG